MYNKVFFVDVNYIQYMKQSSIFSWFLWQNIRAILYLQNGTKLQINICSSNIQDLYLENACFESWKGHRI